MFITNVQNICNWIGREEYNVGCTVLSISILYSLAKKPVIEIMVGHSHDGQDFQFDRTIFS